MNQQVAEYFRRIQLQPAVVSGHVSAVTVNADTGQQEYATVVVGGNTLRVRLDASAPNLASGDAVRLSQYGYAASAEYRLAGIEAGGRPSSGGFQILNDGTIVGGGTYAGGDFITGKLSGGNVFFEYATGRIYHRVVLEVYGIEYPTGEQLWGHCSYVGGDWTPDGPNVYITPTTLCLRNGTVNTIRLDADGTAWVDKELTAGSVRLDDWGMRIGGAGASALEGGEVYDIVGGVRVGTGVHGLRWYDPGGVPAIAILTKGAGTTPFFRLGRATDIESLQWDDNGLALSSGAGKVSISLDGIRLSGSEMSAGTAAAIEWLVGTTVKARLDFWADLGAEEFDIETTGALSLTPGAGEITTIASDLTVGRVGGSVEGALITYKGVTINEAGEDSDTRIEGGNEDHLLFLVAGLDVVRLGDGDTNYSQWDKTGHQTLVGSAKPWRDELGELLGKKRKGSRITEDLDEGTVLFADNCALADDWVIANVQLNHDKDLAASIYPHLHWMQASANVPNWLLQYRWQLQGGAKTTAWTSAKYASHAATYVSGTINQITKWAAIAPPTGAGLSDIVQFRLLRDCANASTLFSGADPLTGNASAVMFDLHFQINSLGSNDEYVK